MKGPWGTQGIYRAVGFRVLMIHRDHTAEIAGMPLGGHTEQKISLGRVLRTVA